MFASKGVKRMSNKPIYLGDGLYATFDGHQIELRVGAHTAQPCAFLEREVFENLVDYAREQLEWKDDRL